ncbi:hypothetical protein K431DRAFT_68803 [Polychaeton citri CBS 116435]|uniref:Uncharacterized protein n=1 Tax=Polychaeton citri CBS 116435 TaxID=1314669 RepID=A0A9P4QAU7_9PEZI|nr:hypothetical protein K431DRAFT_68803 [Polychaeton citri CBS 116435]
MRVGRQCTFGAGSLPQSQEHNNKRRPIACFRIPFFARHRCQILSRPAQARTQNRSLQLALRCALPAILEIVGGLIRCIANHVALGYNREPEPIGRYRRGGGVGSPARSTIAGLADAQGTAGLPLPALTPLTDLHHIVESTRQTLTPSPGGCLCWLNIIDRVRCPGSLSTGHHRTS